MLFRQEIEKCSHIKQTLEILRLQGLHGGKEQTLEQLRCICDTHLESRERDKIRKQLYEGVRGQDSGRLGYAGNVSQGACRQWLKGNCPRGDSCPYEHDDEKLGQLDGCCVHVLWDCDAVEADYSCHQIRLA